MSKLHCGAWWCNTIIKGRACRINRITLCRNCYQHVWSESKKAGEPMEVMFLKVRAPKKPPVRKRTKCSREGCNTILTTSMDATKYCWVDPQTPVCRNCYETVWEHRKKLGLQSLKAAYDQLYPKGWRPEPPAPKTCSIPWCQNPVPCKPHYLLEGSSYVCGKCRSYFLMLKRRQQSEEGWHRYAFKAIKGELPAPGTPECCSAPWCNVKISEKVRHRGPNGEALCNNDGMYYYLYSRRHSITFDEAFRTAPPPRGRIRKESWEAKPTSDLDPRLLWQVRVFLFSETLNALMGRW